MTAGQQGFTYLGILAAVALSSTVMGLTLEVWHTAQAREKERELLFIGQQFRQAIERYYLATPGREKKFPLSLDELLEDPRLPGVQRYLRRIYCDPVTGLKEWGLVRGSRGEIMGIYSLSEAKPIKVTNFDPSDNDFVDAQRYADWLFVYRPRMVPSAPMHGTDGADKLG